MKRPLYLGEESIAHRLGGQIKTTEDFFPGSLLGPHLYCFPPLISTSGYLGNRKKWVLDLLPHCKGEPLLNSGRSLTVGMTDGLLRAGDHNPSDPQSHCAVGSRCHDWNVGVLHRFRF